MKKKFIIVNDKTTAEKMISAGFVLLSSIGGVFTFNNSPPKNFVFDSIDAKKICYSNILSL